MKKLLFIFGIFISLICHSQRWVKVDKKEKEKTYFIIYGIAVTFEFDSISPKKYKEIITHYYSDHWSITTKYCNRFRYLQIKTWKEWELKQIQTLQIDSLNKKL